MLQGKVVVITGAGSGIGRALAKGLAKRSCHLALVDINQQGLDETLKLLPTDKGVYSTHKINVISEDEMKQLPEQVIAIHGCVDMLFNNAGTTIERSFAAHSMDDWRFMINLNLWGVLYGCHYFLPYLTARPESWIVNTSSLAGFMGLPSQSSYCVTKAAVKALNESLYAEYHSRNLNVLSVHPGAIRTNIFHAAIDRAEDPEASKKLFALVDKVAMDADKAAEKIIRAAEKKRQRVIVGIDSYLVEFLKRLFPVSIHKLAAYAFKKQRLS